MGNVKSIPANPEALTPYNHLRGTGFLQCGHQISSNNQAYRCIMQHDGNFVLYRNFDNHPLWATATHGTGAVRAVMQLDGNLVVYTATEEPKWSSRTQGQEGCYLVMQDDGNLVIYNVAGRPVWASNTHQKDRPSEVVTLYASFQDFEPGMETLTEDEELKAGQQIKSKNLAYRCIMQQDGNLVLYRNSNDQALWASNTNGSGGVRAVMQADGNLVVYTCAGDPVWASGTDGETGCHLIMQDDGNLVIYNNSGKPVWASNTMQQ